LIWEKYINIVESKSFYQDVLGRWNAYKIINGVKVILFITYYRMPISNSKGIHITKV